MKQLASLFVSTIGFLASIATLVTFVYGTNWQASTAMGFGREDWAIWSAILCYYTIAVVAAVIIANKRRNRQGEWAGAEFILVHMPFSFPASVLWARAFIPIDIPPSNMGASLVFLIGFFGIGYLMLVLLPLWGLTTLMFKVIYD